MLRSKHCLIGDTLIEVAIAIGIFALVAISVVAVVNISMSGAQSALEVTLAREEIDSQAETLRFIQSAYANDSNLDSSGAEDNSELLLYKRIWEKIKSYADANDGSNIEREFRPASCDDLYNKDDENGFGQNYLQEQNAFIIDIRGLNSSTNADDVVLSAKSDEEIFAPATTYPRLAYKKLINSANDEYEEEGVLIGGDEFDVLDKAEGIFIIGVKDNNTTSVVTEDGVVLASMYYDFYIRSCWYNAGAETPSTLSTMIRLVDPDLVAHVRPSSPSPSPEPNVPVTPEPDDPVTPEPDVPVTPEPVEPESCADLNVASLQSWNGEASLGVGQVIELCDERDLQIYKVAKLKDGNVWMIDNLNLGAIPLKENLTSANTNTNFSVSASTFNSWKNIGTWNETLYSGEYYPVSGTDSSSGTKYGILYNYYAVSMGSAPTDRNSHLYIIQNDICPRGWRVPSAVGTGRIDTEDGELDNLVRSYATNGSNIKLAWYHTPNIVKSIEKGGAGLSKSGIKEASGHTQFNVGGYYWSNYTFYATSNVVLNSYYEYNTNFGRSYYGEVDYQFFVQSPYVGNYEWGMAIRCIKK